MERFSSETKKLMRKCCRRPCRCGDLMASLAVRSSKEVASSLNRVSLYMSRSTPPPENEEPA